MLKIECHICSKIFLVLPYRKKIAKYCSNSCKGKSNKGNIVSAEGRKNISKAKLGNKNPMWKGDKVGYRALHQWVKRRLSKPKLCNNCKKVSPHDLANISQKYKRDLDDWEWLCRRCHMLKDGRMKNLKQYQIINN